MTYERDVWAVYYPGYPMPYMTLGSADGLSAEPSHRVVRMVDARRLEAAEAEIAAMRRHEEENR